MRHPRAYSTFNAMLRNFLTALVLASATVACGGESSGPKVVAGAPAGDVTEVTGTVTATRDGKARPLAVGDVVSGDDVVATGADGHVAIRLHHNLVPWTLGPGKTEQVSLSLAWKAPRATQTAAGPIGERSGAAGRHAEREAADTSATAGGAMEEKAAMAEPAPAAAATATMPVPPPAPGPAPKSDDDFAAKAAVRDTKSPEKEVEEAFGSGGLGLTGTGEGGGGSGDGIGLGAGGGGSIGDRGGGAARIGGRPAPVKAIVRVFATTGGLSSSVVTRVVRSRQPRLLACVEPEGIGARAMVKMAIAPDGSVAQVTVTGVSSTATSCLSKWMRATSFPKAKTLTTASVSVQNGDDL